MCEIPAEFVLSYIFDVDGTFVLKSMQFTAVGTYARWKLCMVLLGVTIVRGLDLSDPRATLTGFNVVRGYVVFGVVLKWSIVVVFHVDIVLRINQIYSSCIRCRSCSCRTNQRYLKSRSSYLT